MKKHWLCNLFGHDFSYWKSADNDYHARVCSRDGTTERALHAFGDPDDKCDACNGKGEYEVMGGYGNNPITENRECELCNGTGKVDPSELTIKCRECNFEKKYAAQ